jgi:hypothetical protein
MPILTGRRTPIWKRARGVACPQWYTCRMKKVLSVSEFARLGGKARAQKLSKERRVEISRAANEAKRLKRAERRK